MRFGIQCVGHGDVYAMSELILPTDRPIYYAATGTIAGQTVAEHGATRVGDATGVAGVLDVAHAEDENDYLGQLSASDWPALPDQGEWLEAGDIYQHDGQAVMVRQSHNRTEHDPADVPALFMVYREDAGDALGWIAGEQVYVGTRRLYEDIVYKCLQAHVTQADWVPPVVPALWQEVQPPTDEWAPWTPYTIGDIVSYEGLLYQCRQSHTSQPGWEPPAVLALWLPL